MGRGVLVLSSTAVLGGCSSQGSSDAERAAEATTVESPEDQGQAVTSSKKTKISVDNQLVPPDGTPATVTWQVTETENSYWDGSSRPNHAPPQGFQGLVQESGSGAYQARVEVNDTEFSRKKPNFRLTPSISVNNEVIALEPLVMVYDYYGWVFLLKNRTVYGSLTSPTFTAQTSRGELDYQIIATCPSLEPRFVIKSVG